MGIVNIYITSANFIRKKGVFFELGLNLGSALVNAAPSGDLVFAYSTYVIFKCTGDFSDYKNLLVFHGCMSSAVYECDLHTVLYLGLSSFTLI